MGCCEAREDVARPVNRSRRKHTIVKALLTGMSEVGSLQELCAEAWSSDRSPILNSVVELAESDEPELYAANRAAEELILSLNWTHFAGEETVQVKYHESREFGLTLYSQLCFAKVVPCEVLLRVINSPNSRLLWDTNLSAMVVVRGNDVLDATVDYGFKGQTKKTATRYVRKSREALMMVQCFDEPAEKNGCWWIRECTCVQFMYVWVNANGTIVELIQSTPSKKYRKASIKEYFLWSEKFYDEVLYQIP